MPKLKTKRDIMFNSLGEWFRGNKKNEDDDCVLGCINVGELAARLKKDPMKVSNKDVANEFDRMAKEEFNEREYAFYQKACELQKQNTDKFRVYGWIVNGKEKIILVTEALELSENKSFWELLNDFAEREKAKIGIMHESKRLDETTNIKTGVVTRGPGHGKMEKQVEVVWDITDYNSNKLKRFISYLEPKIEWYWFKYGVSVI